jgi:AraC-like DNA-binding protein
MSWRGNSASHPSAIPRTCMLRGRAPMRGLYGRASQPRKPQTRLARWPLPPPTRTVLSGLSGATVPLEAVWPDGAEVADQVGSVLGSERAIARLADVLTTRLSRIASVPADLQAAVARIMARGGRVDVSRLADSLGVTRQHLARRFAAHVGVSPKTFCRVVRLWEVLRSAGGGRVNWASLAADLGYSDQSHLVTEFRSLTGLTPSRWVASRRSGSKSPSRSLANALS